MKDFISREEAISHPFANGRYDHKYVEEYQISDFILGFEDYKEWLEQLPSVNVRESIKGKWIYDPEDYPLGNPNGHYECDQCGESMPHKSNFCPNCGADMRQQ